MAWPARASIAPPSCSTRTMPRSTIVYSSNSGRCPGSAHPGGLFIWARLTAPSPSLACPTNSSIVLGGSPAAATLTGDSMSLGIGSAWRSGGTGSTAVAQGAGEDQLAQPHRPGRHLHALVLGDELQRLFEREGSGRREPDQL